MEEQETREMVLFNPQRALVEGRGVAEALMSVISKKARPVIINNEQYLEYEDWQFLAAPFGLGVKTRDPELVVIDGVSGFKAKAEVVNQQGVVVGGAEAYCMRDEENWAEKPTFQLASMAQTRAASKALANRMRWVAVLGGFKTTPAEEMVAERKVDWKLEREQAAFKTGKEAGVPWKDVTDDKLEWLVANGSDRMKRFADMELAWRRDESQKVKTKADFEDWPSGDKTEADRLLNKFTDLVDSGEFTKTQATALMGQWKQARTLDAMVKAVATAKSAYDAKRKQKEAA